MTRYSESRTGKVYSWKNRYLGLVGCNWAYSFARKHGTDLELLKGNFVALGITPIKILAYVLKHCPALAGDYKRVTKKDLTGDILISRLHNMFRDKENKKCIGPEHPLNHAKLRPILEAMILSNPEECGHLKI